MKYTRLYRVLCILFVFCALKFFVFAIRVPIESYRFFGHGTIISLPAIFPLRVTMAFIFIWYSLEHVLSGEQFSNLTNKLLEKCGIKKQFNLRGVAKIFGVLELLVALSFVLGFYTDIFSLIAVILLSSILGIYFLALSAFLFTDIVFLGAAITLFLLTL